MAERDRHFRFVPKADIHRLRCAMSGSANDALIAASLID
jgi:hypothetical protein